MNLTIPDKLKKGDKVAIVSLSWGGAGDAQLHYRYNLGKKRLEEEFGLIVVEMNHTLKGSEYLEKHPEHRAKDLMDAFSDKSIKGIFSMIGGDDTIRLLPYIDYSVIKDNPKVFLGYSDTTVNHFMCLKANLRSYYGPAVLVEFGENVAMHSYTKQSVLATLFTSKKIGEIKASTHWTNEDLPWEEQHKNTKLGEALNQGHLYLQGEGLHRGPLIGGCIDVLEMIKGTFIWPSLDVFDGAVLFLETSEEQPSPSYLKYWLRGYGAMGVFDRIHGLIIGKPNGEKYFKEYQEIILKVVKEEYHQSAIPIVYNLNFGHTSPMTVIPYGAVMTIDCDKKTLIIDESGVK